MAYADNFKNISCLVGHLFKELYPPCKDCSDERDCLVLTGLGHDGKDVRLVIKDEGIFEVYGSEKTLEEVDKIRTCRCFNGRR